MANWEKRLVRPAVPRRPGENEIPFHAWSGELAFPHDTEISKKNFKQPTSLLFKEKGISNQL